MEYLPADILRLIFNRLHNGTQLVCRFVCPRWRNLIKVDKDNVPIVFEHLNVLKWAYAKGLRLNPNLYDVAAAIGKIDILEWLKNVGCQCHNEVKHFAIVGNQVETLKWLNCNGYPVNRDDLYKSIKRKKIEIMHYLLDETELLDSAVFTYAASTEDSIDIMIQLKNRNCPWNDCACMVAASYNFLNNLKWLREQGCPWDRRTTWSAAYHGYLDILKWAVANGCPFDRESCIAASVAFKHNHVVEWIQNNT
jgi:F-box domain